MSLRTCSWLFPQKEQRYGTLGPLVLLLDVVTVPVPVLLVLDLVERLTGVAGQDLVVALDEVLPLTHLDDRVGGVAAEPARALVDHDPAVRQGVALALRAGRQQHRRRRGRHADADRADRRAQV